MRFFNEWRETASDLSFDWIYVYQHSLTCLAVAEMIAMHVAVCFCFAFYSYSFFADDVMGMVFLMKLH